MTRLRRLSASTVAALLVAAPLTLTAPAGYAAAAAQEARLSAADGMPDDQFGSAVAVSGDTAVVGVPYDSHDGSYQGAAYVFVRSGTGWVQQARLTASDGTSFDRFGKSVAVSGDTVLVGSVYDDASTFGDDHGSAYVFVRSGTGWTQQAHLTADDGADGNAFGWSVALEGETALVGAYWRDAAYVFTRTGSTWSQQAELTATGGSHGDTFGTSVAITGDTALVGAQWWATAGGINDPLGTAYVFTRSGGSWTQQAQLTAADGVHGDFFGASVALSGETALVGNGQGPGAAYVYTRSGTSWAQQAKLTAADRAAYDCFGTSVSLSGDTALVGSPYSDRVPGTNDNQGAAYLFTRTGATWAQQARLTSSDGAAGDNLGYAVAMTGSTAVVGAPKDDVGSGVQLIDQGSAYVFQLDGVAPATTAAFAPGANPAGWRNAPVTATLSAADAGSGIAATFFRVGDSGPYGTYSAAAKPVVSTNGVIGFWYYSVDRAGNAETPARVVLRIDTVGPTTQALANATVRRGARVKLRLRVDDATSAQAAVSIRIYQGKVLKKTLVLGTLSTGTDLGFRYRCTLRTGRYTWKVYASDLAGNPQTAIGHRTLKVT